MGYRHRTPLDNRELAERLQAADSLRWRVHFYDEHIGDVHGVLLDPLTGPTVRIREDSGRIRTVPTTGIQDGEQS
jgi:hypothetical protein